MIDPGDVGQEHSPEGCQLCISHMIAGPGSNEILSFHEELYKAISLFLQNSGGQAIDCRDFPEEGRK